MLKAIFKEKVLTFNDPTTILKEEKYTQKTKCKNQRQNNSVISASKKIKIAIFNLLVNIYCT